ncbi:MAG: hypothetical protein ACUVYA_14395, partial [Planctomycetota bacterium]
PYDHEGGSGTAEAPSAYRGDSEAPAPRRTTEGGIGAAPAAPPAEKRAPRAPRAIPALEPPPEPRGATRATTPTADQTLGRYGLEMDPAGESWIVPVKPGGRGSPAKP